MSTSPIERLLSLGKPHAKREVNERRAAIARRIHQLKASTLPPKAPSPTPAAPGKPRPR